MRLIIYVMLLLYPFSLLPAASGGKKEKNLSDEELMTLVQKQTFRYFWDYGHPVSGLARERSNGNDDIVTIGGSGFGVMAIIVGAERGFVTREQAAERMLKIVSFLNDKNTDSYHGIWAHWINGQNGETISFSRKDDGADLVEIARGRIIRLEVTLCGQKECLTVLHRRFQRADGKQTAHIEVDYHIRERNEAAQRKHRQAAYSRSKLFCHSVSPCRENSYIKTV